MTKQMALDYAKDRTSSPFHTLHTLTLTPH